MVGKSLCQTQIRLNECDLATGLFRPLPPRACDLLRIGSAVYAADRLARRENRGDFRGSRAMRIQADVTDPDFWNDKRTIEPMRAALELLSADTWEFAFRYGAPDPSYLGDKAPSGHRVCLYSGGLDSAAGLATRLRNSGQPLITVTIWHQGGQKKQVLSQLTRIRRRYGIEVDPIIVRTALFRPPQLNEQELSQRCRSFLFAALAGAVAMAKESSEIEVYENGVGAINLPLMHGMSTGARTTRSSHPAFLRQMSHLLTHLSGRPVEFTLPHRGLTKAELVKTLAMDGLDHVATSTVSCVHYPVRGEAKQCGWCPACIGRRQALLVAGIAEAEGVYECDLFCPPRATDQIDSKKLRNLKATLLQVDRMAQLNQRPLPDWFLRHSLGTRVEVNADSLEEWIGVLLRYRSEWLELSALGQSKGWKWANWIPLGAAALGRC
jgi:7-cyano-7-deazaguanine synthase in queuosine biosynthesis